MDSGSLKNAGANPSTPCRSISKLPWPSETAWAISEAMILAVSREPRTFLGINSRIFTLVTNHRSTWGGHYCTGTLGLRWLKAGSRGSWSLYFARRSPECRKTSGASITNTIAHPEFRGGDHVDARPATPRGPSAAVAGRRCGRCRSSTCRWLYPCRSLCLFRCPLPSGLRRRRLRRGPDR